MKTRPLFFISSYPRSGNTWVRAFLFAMLRETGNLPEQGLGLDDLDAIMPWDISSRFVGQAIASDPKALTVAEIAAARPVVHRWFSTSYPGPPMIKTHSFYGTVHGHRTIPDDIYLGSCYLVRNPLDVAPSLAKLLGVDVDSAIRKMCRSMKVMPGGKGSLPEFWGSWSQNVASWSERGPPRTLVLKYEDMLADPGAAFRRLSTHIGFKATEAQMTAALDAAGLGALEQAEISGTFQSPSRKTDKFFGSGVRRHYREKLTSEQACVLVLAHALQMDRFGYLDDDALAFAGITRGEALAASTVAR